MPARTRIKAPVLTLPSRFQQMKSLHGDPPMSVPYGYVTESAECFLMVSPIDSESAMPFHDPQAVIDGIHQSLAEEQGLIEVGCGVTKEQRRYICSVVKTLRRMRGVQYTLSLQLENGDSLIRVQGFFSETGATGARDALIFALLEKQGEVQLSEEGVRGWTVDPYDPFFTFGTLMNLSEQPRFDGLFPAHPLSELRKFVNEVIREN